jgi:PAS domain S-box-containing protein
MNIDYISPSIEHIRGFTRQEVLAQSPDQMMTPQSVQVLVDTIRALVSKSYFKVEDPESPSTSSETENTCELELYHKDGSLVIMEAKFTFLRDVDESVIGILGFGRDISERRRAEVEIRKLNLELEERVRQRTEQLQAVNEELEAFAYSVSHDLRAPLRGIDGYTRFFIEDYGNLLDENGSTYLQKVREAAQRMNTLIDNLLQLSRLSRREMVFDHIDLSQLVQNVVNELLQDIPTRIVKFEITPGLDCTADKELLRVALTNLVSNALKFSSHENPSIVCFGATEQKGEQVFYIQDNGVGFDMEYVKILFQPFQRLHKPEEFEGTGIGLATVRRIIQRHGGEIWAESTPGQGATFYFTLAST